MGTLSPAVTGTVTLATGWTAKDLAFLVSTSGFSLSDADFVNEIGTSGTGLVALQTCFSLLQHLGISAQQLFSWASFDQNPANEEYVARDIQNTTKSKYDDTTWTTVGKPLNDTIREDSKEALIAYILGPPMTNGWTPLALNGVTVTTADQLYEYFLIDVQMSPCMLTSRIVQATAAVQLFVQRCLMNLELPNVLASAIDATQWEWMQNFRVWQAARQVLLYPENWMVPTLRDDMTPFFQDLENALLQNPITNDNVEDAYLDYLYSLDEVALVDVRGIFWQLDANPTPAPDMTPDATYDVLHVFARTTSQPYKYYYRRLLNCSQFVTSNGNSTWTPWEKVSADIQADHLVPVVWDHRLYLFWPTFQETADTNSQGNVSVPHPGDTYTTQSTAKDLSITLNWSEYRQGTWSSKRSSDPLVFVDYIDAWSLTQKVLDTSLFSIMASPDSNNALSVDIYFNQEQVGIIALTGTSPIWSSGNSVNQLSQTAPALAVFNGTLFLAFVATDGTNNLYVCSSTDGVNWTGGEKVNQLSQKAPALAVFNGTLFLAFVATDGTNNLYVCSSTDGVNWTGGEKVNQLSQKAPRWRYSTARSSLRSSPPTGPTTFTSAPRPTG